MTALRWVALLQDGDSLAYQGQIGSNAIAFIVETWPERLDPGTLLAAAGNAASSPGG